MGTTVFSAEPSFIALQEADFEQVAQSVDPYLAEKGKLTGLMVCARAFPGWADDA
ncbi:MAG: hypothetical protein JNK68_06915 [Betaproteobacteria bacterium]|nr:hypothetical protein [Betaproteobacteria bacterium]